MKRVSMALCVVLVATSVPAQPVEGWETAAVGANSEGKLATVLLQDSASGRWDGELESGSHSGQDEQQESAEALLPQTNETAVGPILCGTGDGNSCMATAHRVCWLLGLGEPMEFLSSGGELYALRCDDGS